MGMRKKSSITILGGGPAGLAVAYFAKKKDFPFAVYEANSRVGGNAITFECGPFRFDSGAHRFHDKNTEVTEEIKKLLGEDLRKVDIPSAIYHKGSYINFPLVPLDLLSHLGFFTCSKAAFELLKSNMKNKKYHRNFEELAISKYGKTIAGLFLLNYSEKLWGISCDRLSPNVSGKRMKGLTLKTFLKETVWGKGTAVKHLDGSFYYPKNGIGTIVEKLAEYCGQENIYRESAISRIFHNGKRLNAIEINGQARLNIATAVSTLALPHLLQLLYPKVDENILSLAKTLRFRHMILITTFVNKNSVTDKGSIYFPENKFPFTRVYEPKNRSTQMSPDGKTSLCAEIPCDPESGLWSMNDKELADRIHSHFIELKWISKADIIDTEVKRLKNAYPVLEKDSEEKIQKISTYLSNFENLIITGRNGKFCYAHVHEMIRFGKDIVDEYFARRKITS